MVFQQDKSNCQHIAEIEEMNDWDKLMLQCLGRDGYAELLKAREKRKAKRFLVSIGATTLGIIGIFVALVTWLQL